MHGYPSGGNYGSNYPQQPGGGAYGGPPGGAGYPQMPPMNPGGGGGPYPYGAPSGMPMPGGGGSGGGGIGFDGSGNWSAPGGGFPSADYGGGYPQSHSPSMQGGGPPSSGYVAGQPPSGGYSSGYPAGQPGGGYSTGQPPSGHGGHSGGYQAGGVPQSGYTQGGGSYPQGGSGSYPQGGGGYPQGGGGYPQGGGGYPQGGGGYPGGQGHGQPNQGYGGGAYAGGGYGGSIGSGGERHQGTIRPDPSFSAEADCNTLRKAMRGIGTDEQAIINVLARRSAQQRQQIKTTYKTMFGKDLIQELRSELSGRFEDAVLALLMDPVYYDAHCLRQAMQGAGTKEHVLTEIMTTRTNQQIHNIREVYKREYHRELEKDLASETSGFYRRVLVSCAQGGRQELNAQQLQALATQGPQAVVDRNLAMQEAQELYQAGERQLGTDESCFIRIIAIRNMYQLRATFDEYQRVSGHNILTSIDRETSGDFGDALKSLAFSQINRPHYFAKRLYHSMRGMGTNDTTLIRVIVTRSEIDLADVKREFQQNFGKSLESFISDDTSGDYKKLLMAICAGNCGY